MLSATLLKQRTTIRRSIFKLKAGPQRRYPVTVRREIARYARGRLSQGASRSAVCRELGVGSPTVEHILDETKVPPERDTTDSATLRPIRVISSGGGGTQRLLLRGPGGVVVEGLDLDGVVNILRGLL